MGSFSNRSYSTASPILALQAHHTPQSAFNMTSARPIFTSPFVKQSPSSSWSTIPTPTSAPTSATSRKRSRDDAADNLCDDDYFPVKYPVTAPVQENEEEWEYGEGMTLIKPKSGYVRSADSQTGTWMEEAEEEAAQRVVRTTSPERPILRSAKSQRLDLTSIPTIAEEVKFSNATLPSPTAPSNGISAPSEPTIDDFTRHLGIGWSMISNEDHIQAAVRGWTKYIENHYPITKATIRLQSRGLASYLVEATEGYFLFGEDLKQGRLVSRSLDKTFENLRGPVPIFDSDDTLEAGQTPKLGTPVLNSMTNENINDLVMNGIDHATATNQTLEVEMDMS